MGASADLKSRVESFWDEQSCGEVYATGEDQRAYYESQAKVRYDLNPALRDFAQFQDGHGKDVLEIGVGMGADHVQWANSSPKSLSGIDLTKRAIDHTSERLAIYGLESQLDTGDAENLPFPDDSFDIVYSYGVLHHSPNTPKAIQEVHRVLRPGGNAKIMIYHKYSITGFILWLRYGLLRGRPFRSLEAIYGEHLESPGTKAYSVDGAKAMFADSQFDASVKLSSGDLLTGAAGQRHRGLLLTIAKSLWPRWLISLFLSRYGLWMFIVAKK